MKSLWQDYLFLTNEMMKFAGADDLELFEDLLGQRNVLLGIIENAADEEKYTASSEGQELIKKIAATDIHLREKILLARNNLTKNFNLSSAYDGFLGDSAGVGNRFDSNSH